jgi:hypothetical protein
MQPNDESETTMSELSEPCIPSTQVEIGGFTWTIYADTNEKTIDKIELVTRALAKRGYCAPKRVSFGGGGKPPAKPLAQPLVDGDGTPCCPFHTNRDGRPTPIRYIQPKNDLPGFWGCPSQAQQAPGETINQRGYCSLRFDWPAESAPLDNGKVTR